MASPRKRQKLVPLSHSLPLTCARVVCRERPSILGIAHVVTALDELLDWSPRCTIAKACALCSPRLLQRVLAREALEPADSAKRDPRFRQWQFERGMISAVESRNLELVQVLSTQFQDCKLPSFVAGEAALSGRLEILKWLYANRPDMASHYCSIVDLALSGNHFEVAKWLRTKVPPPTARMMASWAQIAAEKGSLEMVKWACGQSTSTLGGLESKAKCIVAAAVNGGHLDILVWLLENICGDRTCFSVSLNEAVCRDHMKVLEWILRNEPAMCRSLDSADVTHAARYGRLDILRLLHAYMVDGRATDAIDYAAGNGHLDTINGCTRIVRKAVPRDAMDWAAGYGHMEVLQWLAANRTEGCSPEAMDDAAANGHLDIVKWLHANRNKGCTFRAMNGAAKKGHLDVMKWLHINRTEGCTVDAMDLAAKNGHVEVVKWLHANRTEGCTVKAMDLAAMHGHLEVVKWLHANRTEGCTSTAIAYAILFDNLEVALFLHCEREECDLATAVINEWRICWNVVDWVYCHYSPDVASAVVATLKTELW